MSTPIAKSATLRSYCYSSTYPGTTSCHSSLVELVVSELDIALYLLPHFLICGNWICCSLSKFLIFFVKAKLKSYFYFYSFRESLFMNKSNSSTGFFYIFVLCTKLNLPLRFVLFVTMISKMSGASIITKTGFTIFICETEL